MTYSRAHSMAFLAPEVPLGDSSFQLRPVVPRGARAASGPCPWEGCPLSLVSEED